ncbi:unnamed protein product [Zymoseptoria tritici ST99CH_3D7]|uniref:Amidase domain-containing protein n=1 Tax=Zymoseptoria tritici (strain ST99CH_3D7) TaxID=1276538 RepID=A0A1X7RCR1_ZYMT9|nr:unnamed protein product [Zymoseptoria tritici ST99CH_3D7]
MIPPFDYFEHRSACKQKQHERSTRIATLPQPYQTPLSPVEREILNESIDKLVENVQNSTTNAVDVLRAYGKAAVKAQEKTNCVTEVMVKEAEQWINSGDINLKGPLAGIPVSLKDSIQVGGFDTTVGYSCNVGKPAPVDGAIVRMLKDAGAVPFVKTALPITLLSFESFNDVWGRCLNPHNPKYSPGGSTGGEGAILAFGGSRIGIGSDVAGSYWEMAEAGSFNIHARTRRYPIRLLANGSHTSGSHLLHTLVHSDEAMDIRSIRPPHSLECRHRARVSRQEEAQDRHHANRRGQGHEVFDVTPPSPYEAMVIASNLLNADGTRTFRSYFRTGETDDAGAREFGRYMRLPRFLKWFYYAYVKYIKRDFIWAGLLEHWHEKSAYENWQWVYKREVYKAKFHAWWNEFGTKGDGMDVMLTPPNATPAVPHDGMKDAASSCGYTFLFNLLDYTCGILPVTHVDANRDVLPASVNVKKMNGVARGAYKHYDAATMAGLPVAVQVVGRRLEEEKVLAVMKRLEDALESRGEKYQLLEVL